MNQQRIPRIQNHRSGLTHTFRKLREGKLTVGFIGGSITDGRNGTTWPEPVAAWLIQNFPSARIFVENVAIGGTGSVLGVFRAQQYLIQRGVDLVFVEYAVNDYGSTPERNRRTQEGLIRKLRAAGCDVVLVYTFCQDMYEDMLAGRAPKTVAAFEELAERYDLGSVWMGMHALQEIRQGLMRWEEWLPDGIHPDARGSLSYAQSVIAYLQKELLGGRGRGASSSRRQALPAPLDQKHWQSAHCLDLADVHTEGPWSIRRTVGYVWYDQILQTAAPGAKLSFDFDGRALVLGLDFNKASAEFLYRLDGGEPVAFRCDERYEWATTYGWYYVKVIAEDLPRGKHHIDIEVIHGNRPGCSGTNFRLALIGVVK